MYLYDVTMHDVTTYDVTMYDVTMHDVTTYDVTMHDVIMQASIEAQNEVDLFMLSQVEGFSASATTMPTQRIFSTACFTGDRW